MVHKPAHSSLLILISAPSGAGKTTLCNRLLEAEPGLTRAITCTTRLMREGEQEGVDYYFLKADDFLKQVQAGEFLEHATVYGNSYGTLKVEVLSKLREGRDVLLNVDVQGAETIRRQAETHPELRRALVTAFLCPPSLQELERRLRQRATDSEEQIETRLGKAAEELAHWNHFDYLVVSQSMDSDLERTRAILEAERLRQFRVEPPVL